MDIEGARALLTWVFAIIFGLVGFTIVLWIWIGKIDLALLISEKDGVASMSRFQMLIFTFVVGISLFLIVVSDPATFPDIPNGILGILGISTGTYAVSKGIQTAANTKAKELDVQAGTASVRVAAAEVQAPGNQPRG